MKKHIYLTGFMGSGKSHIGRELANYFYCSFIDLDKEIEQSAGQSIRGLFTDQGEAYFRLLERRSLHDTQFEKPKIIATGGGTPCFFNNMEWMNQQGTCIFLDAIPGVLQERLWRGRSKRPLIQTLNAEQLITYINRKTAERRPYYEQAEFHIKIYSSEQDTASELCRTFSYLLEK